MNQASIFTLEKNAKGYKDFENLPADIYVDSSAWLCAYGSKNQSSVVASKRGKDIVEFIEECVEQGVTLYHSQLVISEVLHANKQAHLDYIVKNSLINIPTYSNGGVNYKKLNEIVCLSHSKLNKDIQISQEGILEFITNTSVFLPYEQDEEGVNDMLGVMQSTNGLLDTQDATHVCIARAYEINSFLTADADFLYLDNDNIFTVSNEKYSKKKIGRSNVLLDFDKNQY